MKTRYGKLIRILAAWSVLAMILACNMESTDGSSTSPAEPVVEEPAGGGGGGGGGGACSRIAGCCRAYVNAMGATVPASTCDAYNNVTGMQDSLCEQTMAGYRAGLQAMQKSVPSECN